MKSLFLLFLFFIWVSILKFSIGPKGPRKTNDQLKLEAIEYLERERLKNLCAHLTEDEKIIKDIIE